MACPYCDTYGLIELIIQACIVIMTAPTHCLSDKFIATVACCGCYMTCVVLSMYGCMRALTCGRPLAPLFAEEPSNQEIGLMIRQARFAGRRRLTGLKQTRMTLLWRASHGLLFDSLLGGSGGGARATKNRRREKDDIAQLAAQVSRLTQQMRQFGMQNGQPPKRKKKRRPRPPPSVHSEQTSLFDRLCGAIGKWKGAPPSDEALRKAGPGRRRTDPSAITPPCA